MKTARLFTLLGGIVLLIATVLHTTGYFHQLPIILGKAPVTADVAALMRVFWLSDSVQFGALGLIVLLVRNSVSARLVVLTSAFACLANALLMIVLVGFAPPVYIFLFVAILLFIGGAAPRRDRTLTPSS